MAAFTLRALTRHSFIRFALVGVINTAVSMGLANGLHYLGDYGRQAATTAGYCAGILCSFVLNKFWTFSHRPGGSLRRQFPMFVGVNLVGLGLSNLLVGLIGDRLPYWLAYGVAVLVVMLWNYGAMRTLVYKGAASV